ncbi:MAG TPA: type I restriction-modification enzyme R subunit C-terminal domain-containing protein [Pirellulales bacterium]
MNEADTCRTLVRPRLESAGWDGGKHFFSEQTYFTDGRIVAPAGKPRRLKRKFTDFLLRYSRDSTLAVVEAKSDRRPEGDGLQEAKDYADILGLKFAYATNGREIIEHDFFTGQEREIDRFPSPDEHWFRYQQGQGLTGAVANARLVPDFHDPQMVPRYYQRVAIDRAIEAILTGRRRVLLTLATGTGKTAVAFQICWKLWSAGWNTRGDQRKPQFDDEQREPRKFYVRGGKVEIDTEVTYDLDTDGGKLRTVQISQYVADTVRTLYTDADDLRRQWSDFEQRSAVVELLQERGIDFNELAAAAGQPEADPFDLLCHVAYNAPLRTRRERAERLRKEQRDFFDRFNADARAIINELLDKYAEHGAAQFTIPDVFEVPPISRHGNLKEIAEAFGGTEKLVEVFNELQELLYAA